MYFFTFRLSPPERFYLNTFTISPDNFFLKFFNYIIKFYKVMPTRCNPIFSLLPFLPPLSRLSCLSSRI